MLFILIILAISAIIVSGICNIKKINISTDVKLAYKRGIEESIQMGVMEQNGFDPLKVEWFIHDEIQNMVMNKLKLLRKDSLR